MKRQIIAAALAAATLAVGACDSNTPANPGGGGGGGGADRTAACGTFKTAHGALAMTYLDAIARADADLLSTEYLEDFAPEFVTALTTATTEFAKAATETTDADLKTAVTDLSTATKNVADATTAAGTDPAKFKTAVHSDAFDTSERTVLRLCSNL